MAETTNRDSLPASAARLHRTAGIGLLVCVIGVLSDEKDSAGTASAAKSDKHGWCCGDSCEMKTKEKV